VSKAVKIISPTVSLYSVNPWNSRLS